LAQAITAFGTPEQACKWVAVLDRIGENWRKGSLLGYLTQTNLTAEEFAEWVLAGVYSYQVVPLSRNVTLSEALATLREAKTKKFEEHKLVCCSRTGWTSRKSADFWEKA
jgi:hypothetical protein